MTIQLRYHRIASIMAIALLLCTLPVQANQLSRSTHKELNEARDLMDKDKHDAALAKLNKLLDKIGDREYEKALTLQSLGYAYIGMDEDRQAIDAFERALELDALPDSPRVRLQNMLARLYARTEQYAKAYDYLQEWFAEIEKPEADDYALKANILVQLERNKEGIQAIRKAIELSDRPREQYYQILVSLEFAAERYAEAAKTLEDILANWPRKARYWRQLASVYLNLERNEDAHAVLKLAYRKGLLEEGDQIVRLARLGLSIDVPTSAAELMEKEIERGRVKANEDHWELTGHAWARAKEWNKAIAAYAKAAEYGDAGKYHMRRAHMFTYQNDWQGAIKAARQALEDDDLDSPGGAHILIGRGHLELGQHEQAMAAFEAAQNYGDSADQARQWRQYAERQKQYNGARNTS